MSEPIAGKRPSWAPGTIKFWQHAAGVGPKDSPAPTHPFECTFEEAQDWCNFVVLRPNWLPESCQLGALTVRAETSEHGSSLRMVIEGPERALRMKQFYMDWWIPTSSDTNLTGPGRPFIAAGIVGYFGRDYRGTEAACIHRFGSLLEVSVTDGSFQAEEIQSFLERLEPEVPEAVSKLAALPFAQLSYYARKGPSRGPFGYDLLSGCHWSADRNRLRAECAPEKLYYPRQLPDQFEFDSAGFVREESSHHWEYQLLFRHRGNLTDNIWIRATGEGTEKILWISPGLDHRMGIRLHPLRLNNRAVRAGCSSEPYGERVAQWIENGIAFEVHARASLFVGQEEFLLLLDSLSRE
ncbi:MAG: hypothetical protein HY648_02580 [Acidobacteria bacterium]|nr:hypothetical protein [Acidobacteriota bacterium]